MRKILWGTMAMLMLAPRVAAAAAHDTADPLYLAGDRDFVSRTSLTYWDSTLRLGQDFSYGLGGRFVIGGNVHYQIDFDGHEDGFSNFDLGGIYRLGLAADNESKIISDLLFGIKFGGSSHVRTPEYADTIYYAGVRVGREWAGVTLAATLKSSWIFDDARGMAYIDFAPEAYFRLNPDWRAGAGVTLRKATKPHYDQEWANFKLVRQYGRTQYVGHVDYEFESDEVQVGIKVNIVF
ncbi:hypothetical protein HDR63_00565 [bacterium]|nr:hypothetical protein [bacterium]